MSSASLLTLDPNNAASQLFRQVIEGQGAEAHHLMDDLIAADWTLERIVVDLLVVVQQQIGELWQAGRRTICDEHVATAVVDDLLGALGRRVGSPNSQGTVALVCAEGEWHVTPPRMAALLLRDRGWRTILLGGSTPADHLARNLEVTPPTFLAVSCTDARFLLGAARVAGIARSLGIPTIAGGRAFGSSAHRAHRLGFDGWAPTVAEGSQILDGWMEVAPAPEPPTEVVDVGQWGSERSWTGIADQAIQRLTSVSPPVLHHRAQPLEEVRQDLVDLLRLAHLADMCDDPSVFTDFVAWRSAIEFSHGIPSVAVRPTIEVLGDLTASLGGRTQAILRSSVS